MRGSNSIGRWGKSRLQDAVSMKKDNCRINEMSVELSIDADEIVRELKSNELRQSEETKFLKRETLMYGME